MNKLTKEKAKELSIKKWEFIIEKGGDADIEDIPEVKHFKYKCPYCELFVKKDEYGYEYCDGCPLDLPKEEYTYTKDDSDWMSPTEKEVYFKGCCQDNHPWSIWNDDPTVENAEAILKLIKENE